MHQAADGYLLSSMHARKGEGAWVATSDLARDHRDRIHRISLLFESADGRVHSRKWPQQKFLRSLRRHVHWHKFPHRRHLSADWLFDFRILEEEAVSAFLEFPIPSGQSE